MVSLAALSLLGRNIASPNVTLYEVRGYNATDLTMSTTANLIASNFTAFADFAAFEVLPRPSALLSFPSFHHCRTSPSPLTLAQATFDSSIANPILTVNPSASTELIFAGSTDSGLVMHDYRAAIAINLAYLSSRLRPPSLPAIAESYDSTGAGATPYVFPCNSCVNGTCGSRLFCQARSFIRSPMSACVLC